MTLERFAILAEAFGSRLDRWPRDERDQARRLLAAEPFSTRRLLVDAGRLDRLLDRSASPVPTRQLRERVLAVAPVRAPAEAWRWLTGAVIGVSLAAACAAGLVAGAFTPPLAFRPALAAAPSRSSVDPAEEAALLLREPVDLADG